MELDDFSSGTSSRSTKLIHGGVRCRVLLYCVCTVSVLYLYCICTVSVLHLYCRYLQKAIMQLDIEQYKMVKEALHERANLLEIAPHLSFPLPIMLVKFFYLQL